MAPGAPIKLTIASPCSMSWESMAGDERVRHCSACEKNVYNLSAMSRQELLDLIVTREGRVCARLFQRKDGTVLTRDCPVGLQRLRRRVAGWITAGAAAALLLAEFFRLTTPSESASERLERASALPPVEAAIRLIDPSEGVQRLGGLGYLAGDYTEPTPDQPELPHFYELPE